MNQCYVSSGSNTFITVLQCLSILWQIKKKNVSWSTHASQAFRLNKGYIYSLYAHFFNIFILSSILPTLPFLGRHPSRDWFHTLECGDSSWSRQIGIYRYAIELLVVEENVLTHNKFPRLQLYPSSHQLCYFHTYGLSCYRRMQNQLAMRHIEQKRNISRKHFEELNKRLRHWTQIYVTIEVTFILLP